MRIFVFFMILVVVVGVCAYHALGGWKVYYKGPASDHFDGVRFFNPGFSDDKSRADLRRWRRESNPAHWPDVTDLPVTPQPPARVDGADMTVTLIGQSTFLIQTMGINILTDPFFSDRASPLAFVGPKRIRPPAIPLEKLPRIDVVLVSHNHYEHLDARALKAIWRRDTPVILTPLGNDTIIRKEARVRGPVTALDWGQQAQVKGVTFALEQAYHWSARGIFDRRKALWGAFVISTPRGPVYFAGDTGYRDGAIFSRAHAKYGAFRLALLPIGAYEPRWFMQTQHMNPDDAVRAHRDLGGPLSLGMHFGTVRLTDEAVDAPARDLAAALEAHGIAAGRFRMPQFGVPISVP